MTYKPQNRNVTTGVLTGCVVTINADPKKYDISAGQLVIVDWSNPAAPKTHFLSYPGVTTATPPDPLSIFTKLALVIDPGDETLAILEATANGTFDEVTRRNTVALPILIHQFGDEVITDVSDDVQLAYTWDQVLNDMTHDRGSVNKGNIISANGANLSFDKSVGSTSLPFVNAVNDTERPAKRPNDAVAVQGFVYQAQAPAGPFIGVQVAVIDPNSWDNNGVIAVVANNKFTIQPVYFFGQSGTMTVGLGQQVYNSLGEATAAIATDLIVDPPNTVDGVKIAHLVVKQGTTDLSDTMNNSIINDF